MRHSLHEDINDEVNSTLDQLETDLKGGIIPVLQLWWPAQAVKDLWHASRPDAARLGGVGARLPVPSVFFVWWPAWLLAGSGSTAVMTVLAQPQFELTWLIWGTIGTGVQQLATLIAAWALIVIINQVEDHLVADDPTAAFDGNI